MVFTIRSVRSPENPSYFIAAKKPAIQQGHDDMENAADELPALLEKQA